VPDFDRVISFLSGEVVLVSMFTVVFQKVLSPAIKGIASIFTGIGSSSYWGSSSFSASDIALGKLNFNVIESIVKLKYDPNILNNLPQGSHWGDLQYAPYLPNIINYNFDYSAILDLSIMVLSGYMFVLSFVHIHLLNLTFQIDYLKDTHDVIFGLYEDLMKPYWDIGSDYVPISAEYYLQRLRYIDEEIRVIEQTHRRLLRLRDFLGYKLS